MAKVIIVTGASSGIGRATALAFARRGDAVVLAARRAQALDDVAARCERLGGAALAVPLDVTDEAAVQALAQRAVDAFGRIDVWINNAAVSLFGRFEEVPAEAFRRVIDTNLFGYVHGARTALRQFRRQGRGVLVNVSSVVVWAPQAYTSAYVISKQAVRTLSECLRAELALTDAPAIHVCTVMPPSVDTPLFQQAANITGRAVRPLTPIYAPETVAKTIVSLAERPRREAAVGLVGGLARVQAMLLPAAVTETLGARRVERKHFQDRPSPVSLGNLFEPMPEWAQTRGGWRVRGNDGRAAAMALLGAVCLLSGLLLRRRTRRAAGR